MIVRLSQKGFSLIEVLVAVAITSIVGAMIVTLMGNMGNMSQFYNAKEDYDSIYRSVQLLVLNEDLCKNAFRDAGGGTVSYTPGPRSELPAVFVPLMGSPTGGSAFIERGKDFGPGNDTVKPGARLNVVDMFFSEVNAPNGRSRMNSCPPSSACELLYAYTVNLNIRVRAKNGGAEIATKPIPMTIATRQPHGSAGLIVSCFSTSSPAAVCATLGVTYNDGTGQCNIPDCNDTVTAVSSCTPSPAGACTTPQYFLAYQKAGPPVCQCVMSCAGIQGPPGADGARGADGVSPPPSY